MNERKTINIENIEINFNSAIEYFLRTFLKVSGFFNQFFSANLFIDKRKTAVKYVMSIIEIKDKVIEENFTDKLNISG